MMMMTKQQPHLTTVMDRNICMALKETIFVQIIDRYTFAEFLMKKSNYVIYLCSQITVGLL